MSKTVGRSVDIPEDAIWAEARHTISMFLLKDFPNMGTEELMRHTLAIQSLAISKFDKMARRSMGVLEWSNVVFSAFDEYVKGPKP